MSLPQSAPLSHQSSYSPPNGSPPAYHEDAAQATAAAALSEPTSTTPVNGRKRKATGQPGSRGVANLTAEQLAKKRANDREAQRAIRERTRNTIESLANRIKELESQQPFQGLQRVIAERDRALAECEELKKKLAAVASLISQPQQAQQQHQQRDGQSEAQSEAQQGQPNLHGMFDLIEQFIDPTLLTDDDGPELAALTAQQSPLPSLSTTAPPYSHQRSLSGQSYEQHQQHIHPDLRSPHSAVQDSPASRSATSSSTPMGDTTSLRRWSPSLEHAPGAQRYASSNGIAYEQRVPPRAPMQAQPNGERLDLAYVLGPTLSNQTSSNGPRSAPQQSPSDRDPPLYLRVPRNSPPTCPLDSLLLDFLVGRRQQLAAGVPLHEVAGPEYPSLVSLRDSDIPRSHDLHPVTAILVDILGKFPDISMLPEKVAVFYIMFLIFRWQICPCERCFQRIPDWARPTMKQRDVEHAAWVDHVPWPIIRTNLTTNSVVDFQDFFIPFCTKLNLNWPYPRDQVLVSNPSARSQDEAVLMNPIFETHLRDLNNWSMGSIFRQKFPYLIDESVRIQDGIPDRQMR